MQKPRLIETDRFPFEFLSALAKRESWRKEVHRPIYHVHKWWAKRLGSIFRGLTLACVLDEDEELAEAFYQSHDFKDSVVFDPFMGSGTTLGEAHKLGFTVLGRDINPVATEAVRIALSRLDPVQLEKTFAELSRTVGRRISSLYQTVDSQGLLAQTLYYFWVMQTPCPFCSTDVDLLPAWIRARNAYPKRKPEVQIVCPSCDTWFQGLYTDHESVCRNCGFRFDPRKGPARGSKAQCTKCDGVFSILGTIKQREGRPRFRLHGKLVLTNTGEKEYLSVTEADHRAFEESTRRLEEELKRESFRLPILELQDGHNTRQALGYGFQSWRDFFNPRQLLALGWLHETIADLPVEKGRDAFLILLSGVLEFNNMFASYKGEGTGAVRHMFSHHILKPERAPIEANVWGTSKSSGSFSGLFRSRLLRAVRYQEAPTELKSAANGKSAMVCSPPFSGKLRQWTGSGEYEPRAIYLSCGDSAKTDLACGSADLILTDPPFFDNVHYSELADFFYAWQQLTPRGFINGSSSTRVAGEVQDKDAERFAEKLRAVFIECHRVLKDEGLLVFTYHHSRSTGWTALAQAILGSGFRVVNTHPLKSEMSVATPKAQAKDPIQLDIAIVCRKDSMCGRKPPAEEVAISAAKEKLQRLEEEGLSLSRNDQKVVVFGQLLTTLREEADANDFALMCDRALAELPKAESTRPVRPALDSSSRFRGRAETNTRQISLFR